MLYFCCILIRLKRLNDKVIHIRICSKHTKPQYVAVYFSSRFIKNYTFGFFFGMYCVLTTRIPTADIKLWKK